MAQAPAVQRRLDALRALCSRHVNAANDYTPTATREQIAADIETLAPLGRTDRWKGEVAGWATLVLDTDYDLTWAFNQGGIYVGYAAL